MLVAVTGVDVPFAVDSSDVMVEVAVVEDASLVVGVLIDAVDEAPVVTSTGVCSTDSVADSCGISAPGCERAAYCSGVILNSYV